MALEFMKLMEDWSGYAPVQSHKLSEAAQARFIDLISNADRLPSHKQKFLLEEAMTTSDFPALFGLTIERQLLAKYKAAIPEWRKYTKVKTLTNFNPAERHKVYGQDSYLPRVSEKGEYLVTQSGNAHYHVQLYKYGRQFDISWEATINDILGAFEDIPERFALAATRTEARHVTNLFSSAAGPNPLLFGAPITDVDGQLVVNLGDLPLTIGNLAITLGLMGQQTDPNGEPITVRGVHLVVPPILEIPARAILTSAFVQHTEIHFGVVTGPWPMPTGNIMPQMGLQLHVDPYLPIVDTTTGLTGWYLFADPSEGESMEMDFLRGYEVPEICMKASDKVTVTGAPLSAFSGDFATDNILYRVRAVHGGTQLDPRYCYAQDGTHQDGE